MTDQQSEFEEYYLKTYHIDLNSGAPEMKEFNYMDSLVVDRFKIWNEAYAKGRDFETEKLLERDARWKAEVIILKRIHNETFLRGFLLGALLMVLSFPVCMKLFERFLK